MPTLSLSNSKNDFRQGDSGSTNRGEWLRWINRGGDLGHWQFPSWQCSQESEEVVGWGRVTLSISLSVFPSKCSYRFSTSLFPSLSLSVFSLASPVLFLWRLGGLLIAGQCRETWPGSVWFWSRHCEVCCGADLQFKHLKFLKGEPCSYKTKGCLLEMFAMGGCMASRTGLIKANSHRSNKQPLGICRIGC